MKMKTHKSNVVLTAITLCSLTVSACTQTDEPVIDSNNDAEIGPGVIPIYYLFAAIAGGTLTLTLHDTRRTPRTEDDGIMGRRAFASPFVASQVAADIFGDWEDKLGRENAEALRRQAEKLAADAEAARLAKEQACSDFYDEGQLKCAGMWEGGEFGLRAISANFNCSQAKAIMQRYNACLASAIGRDNACDTNLCSNSVGAQANRVATFINNACRGFNWYPTCFPTPRI